MNSKRSGAVRLPLKEPVILKSEHDPFLYGNIAKRDVIETISRKAISSLSKEISENYGLQESMLHVEKMKSVILNL